MCCIIFRVPNTPLVSKNLRNCLRILGFPYFLIPQNNLFNIKVSLKILSPECTDELLLHVMVTCKPKCFNLKQLRIRFELTNESRSQIFTSGEFPIPFNINSKQKKNKKMTLEG